MATTLLEDWKSAQIIRNAGDTTSATNHQETSRQEVIRWEKPARGRYKCNIDTSFSSSLNRVGMGMSISGMIHVTLCMQELIGLLLYVMLQ